MKAFAIPAVLVGAGLVVIGVPEGSTVTARLNTADLGSVPSSVADAGAPRSVVRGLTELAGFPAELDRLARHPDLIGPMSEPSNMADPSVWLDFDPWNGEVPPNQLVATCFVPGTPPNVIKNWYAHMHGGLNDPLSYFTGCRWSGTVGTPRALKWSLVPDGLSIASGAGEPVAPSELFSRMDVLFGGNRALWVSRIQMVFDRWEELGGTSYTRVTASGVDWDDGAAWGTAGGTFRGDVRISMKPIGGSIFAFNFFPCSGGGISGDMVINRSFNWGSSFASHRFLRNIVAHEHGHGIGLEHVCPVNSSKLMEPSSSQTPSFDGPRQDDIRAQHALYGDFFEPDNNAFTASLVGTLNIGSTVIVGEEPNPTVSGATRLSLHADGTSDWFEFTLAAGAHVAATAVPIGTTYDSSVQLGGGSCSSGNFVNALTIANLAVEVVDTDGTTVIASAESEPVGVAEVVEADFLDPGNYFVRVYETNAPNQTQLYRLQLTATDLDPCIFVQCDNGLFCDGAETCNNGVCFSGTPPCSGAEVCNEGAGVCLPAPGACCLSDGSCDIIQGPACTGQAGFYYGNGSDCSLPLNPPCFAAAGIMSCQLASPIGFAGTSVPMEVFAENLTDLNTYQFTITTTTLSGVGTLDIDCSQCTADPADSNCGISIDDSRGDFVFTGQGTSIVAVNCDIQAGGALILVGGVDVLTQPAYLGQSLLTISADATPGTQFEVTFSPDQIASFLAESTGDLIPFQRTSCLLTVADPGDCLPPSVVAEGSRTLLITPVGAAPMALQVSGDLGDPQVACVSQFVQADHSLGPNPVFQTPAAWGVVAAHGINIIPDKTYNVQAFCDPDLSAPMSATTGSFGDIQSPPDGNASFADIQLGVFAFQGDFSNVTLERADIWPCIPDRVANLADVQSEVFAFQSSAYADFCPTPCP